MNGREQIKQARAKALGRERHPSPWSEPKNTNRYALELTLIELGAGEQKAFWAMYSVDSMAERAAWMKCRRWSKSDLGLHIALISRTNDAAPLPLP